MSASTAELTLIIRAQNLAEGAFNSVKTQMLGVVATGKQVARDLATAFKGIGRKIAGQMGNVASDLLSGGSLANNFVYIGATLAGAIIEGLSVTLVPQLIARIAATSVWAPVAAAAAEGGLTVGTVITAAIATGMAAAPFILLAALGVALVYLITSQEARNKAKAIGLMIIGKVGDGLRGLGQFLIGIFTGAVAGVASVVGTLVYSFKLTFYKILIAVQHVVAGIIKAIKDAIAWVQTLLNKLGQSALSTGHTVAEVHAGLSGHASGGWVGLHGPELGLLGERGPEYVVPNHQLGAMGSKSGGFTIQGISEREIVDMVDRGLYFKLQRSVPTTSRT